MAKQTQVRTIKDADGVEHEITFSTVPLTPEGRWVFAGSITAGGYKTVDDAAKEAEAQLQGRLQGILAMNAGHRPSTKVHRATWRDELAELAGRY
jgi:hypothetical protein